MLMATSELDTVTAATTAAAAVASGEDAANAKSRRRRRSRWSDAPDNAGGNDDGMKMKKRRASRWGKTSEKMDLTPQMAALSAHMDPIAREKYLLRLRLQDLSQKLMNVSSLIPDDPTTRSPSPPPAYDQHGKRTNTREQRIRDKLMTERAEVIEKQLRLNPDFQAPGDYQRQKLTKKITVPVDEYPGYNFMGVIIGPRGDTHRQLEQDSGAKISVRGKGSVKEGRTSKPAHPDDTEPLFVLIQADSQAQVDKAAEMVEDLLVPVADDDARKIEQMRKLARYNGTLRDEDERCALCGVMGHYATKCMKAITPPKPALLLNVMCQFCLSRSHLSADCVKVNGTTAAVNGPTASNTLSVEYENLLAELGGDTPAPIAPIPSTPPLPALAQHTALAPTHSFGSSSAMYGMSSAMSSTAYHAGLAHHTYPHLHQQPPQFSQSFTPSSSSSSSSSSSIATSWQQPSITQPQYDFAYSWQQACPGMPQWQPAPPPPPPPPQQQQQSEQQQQYTYENSSAPPPPPPPGTWQ